MRLLGLTLVSQMQVIQCLIRVLQPQAHILGLHQLELLQLVLLRSVLVVLVDINGHLVVAAEAVLDIKIIYQ
jgi:hypothetical protein